MGVYFLFFLLLFMCFMSFDKKGFGVFMLVVF